jgi:hypothetical protein
MADLTFPSIGSGLSSGPSSGPSLNVNTQLPTGANTIAGAQQVIKDSNAQQAYNDTVSEAFESFYSTDNTQTNWYQALPYGFKFVPRTGKGPVTMFLPISPQNLTITTHYATNVITTLYGTVEEHSEQRYFDIVIEGTTGMTPKYVDINASINFNGRRSFKVADTIPSGLAGGFFSKTIGLANTALNRAADALAPINNVSGVDIDKTGYLAFHNLYRFFLYYKQDAAGQSSIVQRTTQPLTFLNYKDNNKYSCAVQRFMLKRSAENPMLYNYSIVLRAYNIQDISESDQLPDTLTNRLADLGLNGVTNSSIFATIKNASSAAKSFAGALSGGVNLFGA